MPTASTNQTTKDPQRVYDALGKIRKLPASARLVQRAIQATEDPLCSNTQLQAILSVDAGATADILRLANSPFFGVGSRIRTLSMAITVIGHARLRSLLRHLMVSNLFQRLSVDTSLADRVWTLGLAAGTACYAIGAKLLGRHADDLLMGGLLHNVGELALLCELPDEYEKVSTLSQSAPRSTVETAVFGVSSPQVDRWLLEAWHFPETFLDGVAYWETPLDPRINRNSRQFVAIVHVGVHLAQSWAEQLDADLAAGRASPEALAFLKLKSEKLKEVYETLGPDIEKLRKTFSPA